MRFHGHALAVASGLALLAAPATAGEDGVQHYAAEKSETLAEALANFSEYNAKVEEILAREDLTVADMERIHQLTYTLEIALAKINETMTALPDRLETLHLTSEEHDPDEVRAVGSAYLGDAQAVIP
jgi:hypothetical protein